MSSRLFQNVILQMREVTGRVVGVINGTGEIVACAAIERLGTHLESGLPAVASSAEPPRAGRGYTFKPLAGNSARFEYAVFVEGEDEIAATLCGMAAVALNTAKSGHDEKHDRATFIKNILMDNILPGDIYVRSRELHFEGAASRVVILIRQVGAAELAVVDVVQSLFPEKQNDFVISLSEEEVALVKSLADGRIETEDLLKLAASIEDTIKSELTVRTVIGIGSPAVHLKDLATSYKEAQVAIEVGKVFDTDKTILNYENLGIGRLIYQLPTTLCEMFLAEVFENSAITALDRETLDTIHSFFENNLNVSETSRKLFVHRNTLVYRLEKIKRLTGLDLREFDHAITFKVAMMVRKYLMSREMTY
ncbi:MAG: helix-turn-helix domain-containing protein [Oscillospiraceae bacterium]|nr:helix-turn-helix domain-containing protein [Oscillospiraceae bacterium]